VSTERQEKRKNSLNPRRKPVQERARQRTQQILDITAKLLDEVGFDDLTTILIAKELKISVGSLYHYFPNKHAILYSLGASWLEEMTLALEDTARLNLEAMTLEVFVSKAVGRMHQVYQKQYSILPLAQALWAIPELRELDLQHDDLVITKMVAMFERLGVKESSSELHRLGRFYLELTHSLLLVVVNQKGQRSKRTLEDLKRLVFELLRTNIEKAE